MHNVFGRLVVQQSSWRACICSAYRAACGEVVDTVGVYASVCAVMTLLHCVPLHAAASMILMSCCTCHILYLKAGCCMIVYLYPASGFLLTQHRAHSHGEKLYVQCVQQRHNLPAVDSCCAFSVFFRNTADNTTACCKATVAVFVDVGEFYLSCGKRSRGSAAGM